jgi:hypothetical protein
LRANSGGTRQGSLILNPALFCFPPLLFSLIQILEALYAEPNAQGLPFLFFPIFCFQYKPWRN